MGHLEIPHKLLSIASLFYAGKLDEISQIKEPEAQRFIRYLMQYRASVYPRADITPFEWHGYSVVSPLNPPIASDIEKNMLIHRFLHGKNPLRQATITVATSYMCRSNCKQCYKTEYQDRRRQELSVEQFKTVFRKITNIGVWHIDITGGEPFENPNFFDIIEQIPKDKATAIEATNGINLYEKTVLRIKKSNIMVCKVSLDSYSKTEHDKKRSVEDAFDMVVRGIKFLLKHNIFVFVQAFVERDCWRDNELEKRIQLCRGLGVRHIHVITPLMLGKLKNRRDLLLTIKDRKYVYSLVEKYKADCRMKVFPDWELNQGCLAARGRIYISPYGDVFPCNFHNTKCYGNILGAHLQEMIREMHKDLPVPKKSCVASNISLQMLQSIHESLRLKPT